MSEEHPAERFRAAESGQASGLIDRPSSLECGTREIDTDQFDVARRCHADFGLEQSLS